jgi:vanillate O-demethylase monooxygenase subunit
LAPLVRNAWYVVAARHEFDRTLKQRWILGEPVCFYETTDGRPVVVDDRCAHRRFPLSRSILNDDDSIQCKYHGYTFGSDGRCTLIPGGADPSPVGIRRYPAVQRGPFVWIWTGDNPEAADEDLIPFPDDEIDEVGDFAQGYYFNEGNYSLVHDNLLDLTHLNYLHGIPSGFSDQVFEMINPSDFKPAFANVALGYTKEWEEPLGPAWATMVNEDPTVMIHRTTEARTLTPGFMYGIERFAPHDPDAGRLRKIVIPHCITPANEHQTHQFWMFWSNVPYVVDVKEMVSKLFSQDEEAIGYLQQYAVNDTRDGVQEYSSAPDVPALRFRRTLHRLAAAEH